MASTGGAGKWRSVHTELGQTFGLPTVPHPDYGGGPPPAVQTQTHSSCVRAGTVSLTGSVIPGEAMV
jgi:hypothetical protein